ncbi:MAG: hypothetical protein JW745_04865 [Sedimentisphaerales bacterium]|nr:hypothetical protein [Sedimentisphaerales bacterium]MBN2842582.1 hypothetical protein [Sedimentisphaerales bacterium]
MTVLSYIFLAQSYNPVKSMGDSFRKSAEFDSGPFFKGILLVIAIILLCVLISKIHFRNKKEKLTQEYKLFEDILGELQLESKEKELLREMAKQARLKHPAMCLVTPSLMEKSKELWLKEKGDKLTKSGKIQILNEITHKLHGYSVS